jgi:hypothetical protein
MVSKRTEMTCALDSYQRLLCAAADGQFCVEENAEARMETRFG